MRRRRSIAFDVLILARVYVLDLLVIIFLKTNARTSQNLAAINTK